MRKHEMKRRAGALLLAMALCLPLALPAAAADDPTLTLNKSTLELEIGGTEQLTATVTGVDPQPVITWSSSNGEVAAVANDGTVTAREAGEATITAEITVEVPKAPVDPPVDPGDGSAPDSSAPDSSAPDSSAPDSSAPDGEPVAQADTETESKTLTATCAVTVTAPAVTGISLPTSLTGLCDKPKSLTANLEPTGASAEITWVVSDPTVIKLDGSGETVTAIPVAPGETEIMAKVGDLESNSITLTVSGIRLVKDEEGEEKPVSSLTILSGKSEIIRAEQYGGADEGLAGSAMWTSDSTNVATVSGGTIAAKNPGETTITATAGKYSATCRVIVEENTAGAIPKNLGTGEKLAFADLESELLDMCLKSVDGSKRLDYLTSLQVPTNQGVLHYGYVSVDDTGAGVATTDRYYLNDSVTGEWKLSNVTFVPKQGFSGRARISYIGYADNGLSFTGEIWVEVEGAEDVTYSTAVDSPVRFETADFSAVCKQRTGRDFDYVTFEQPAASRGRLVFSYGGPGEYSEDVVSGEQYFRTKNPKLEQISFIPAEGFTGTARVNYRCYSQGGSYSGQVTVTVEGRKNEEGTGAVSYSTRMGEKVNFRASDFNSACVSATGKSLEYVYFTQPSGSQGTLYYNYRSNGSYDSRVDEGTRYRRRGSPSIDNVTFVPQNGYSGMVEISFTGYDTSGGRFEGTVNVSVSSGGYGEVKYTTPAGQPVTFVAADFNEACQDGGGDSLDYVTFRLPSSTQGTLRYNYRSDSNTGSKVTSTERYYRNGGRTISNVTFVPRSGYRGTVSFDFSGYDTKGSSFSGVVTIEVSSVEDQTVRYTVAAGGSVPFVASDFNSACWALTGSALSYVKFQLPAASQGTLYYKYDTGKGTYTNKVTASTSYYYGSGSRLLNDVAFVPDENSSGTITIPFTGRSAGGKEFSSTVEIQVTTPTASPIRYTGSALPIKLRTGDLRTTCSNALGRELSYIQFTSLPSESVGRLCLNYVSPNQSGSTATTGGSYYSDRAPAIDQLSFIPRAGFQGKVTLRYTGFDVRGARFSGNIEITVGNEYCVSHFTDMEKYGWAKPAVEFLYQNGIANGINTTQYGPDQSVKRCDFVLLLCQAFQFRSGSIDSFADVPANSYYAWAVATAKDLGITQGSGNGMFLPNSKLTRQDAMVMLKRAMQKNGWSLPAGQTSILNSYADGDSVSDYARDAAATLIQLGVINGDQARRLNPREAISRAEIAVVLHQVLTL